jgi:tetratricopeptide (TPR) repeat protein
VKSLKLQLTEREQENLRHDVPGSPAAYEWYLRANRLVLHRSAENMRLARDLYLKCVEQDPSYAPGWARLGRCYRFIEKFGEETRENFELADAAYRRAFALNPDLTIAHNFYTTIEADLGQAPQAMARLLGRGRFKRHDAELFAGLVHACRYCGELQAALVAHERARRLDPTIASSVAHTYFLLGRYQNVLDVLPIKSGMYLDAAAIAACGRDAEAIALLREREGAKEPGGGIRAMMRSLLALLEGDRALALRYVDEVEGSGMKDPESMFYTARHVARLDEKDRAIEMLLKIIEDNFICDFSLAHDPWLISLRSHPRFEYLAGRASERRREAHAAFVAAGGEVLLAPDAITPN